MRLIPLYARDGSVRAYAAVDDADFEWASQWTWRLHHQGYVSRADSLLMHRVLLGLEKGDPRQGDHKNGIRRDNRRTNLRIATLAQNRQNQRARTRTSSRFRGVTWDADRGLWYAGTQIDGERHFVGRFADEVEAGRAVAAFRAEHMPYAIEEAPA